MQGVCYNCFHYAPEGRACPYCGYDSKTNQGKYRVALPPGTPLAKRYIIGRVLGQGGFGITYVAFDDQTKSRVAIKEYLPTEFVSRDVGTVNLGLLSEDRQADFEYGKQQFLSEARTLAEFVGNEHIIGIRDYFEANGTAYFAMEFAEGVNLKQYMEQHGGPLQVYETNKILLPIMEALQWVHSKGIVHRDIAPDNIIIKRDGTAKLIDFGAARYSTGEKSKSLDVVLKHGFAPYEQYSRRGRQGPFTDVYAMAATYYYAITGKVPQDAVDRVEQDELQPPSAFSVAIRKETETVLMKALSVSSKERYQTMAEFYTALLGSMPEPFAPSVGEELDVGNAVDIAHPSEGTKQEIPSQPVMKSGLYQSEVIAHSKGNTDIVADSQSQQKQSTEKAKKKRPFVLVAAVLIVMIIGAIALAPNFLANKGSFKAASHFMALRPVYNAVAPNLVKYIEAGLLYEQKDYEEAEAAFREIPVSYKNKNGYIKESMYQQALIKLNEKEFAQAESIMLSLKDVNYKDADEQVNRIKFEWANHLIYENISISRGYGYYLDLINQGYPEAKTGLREVQDFIYDSAMKAFNSKSYLPANSLFKLIPEYEKASDYMTISYAHTEGVDKNSAEKTVKELLKIHNNSDALEALVCSRRLAQAYLKGSWKTSDGSYYFTMKDNNSINHSLPHISYGDYYDISDGVLFFFSNFIQNDRRDIYKFIPQSADTMKVYCYKNGETYYMYKS